MNKVNAVSALKETYKAVDFVGKAQMFSTSDDPTTQNTLEGQMPTKWKVQQEGILKPWPSMLIRSCKSLEKATPDWKELLGEEVPEKGTEEHDLILSELVGNPYHDNLPLYMGTVRFVRDHGRHIMKALGCDFEKANVEHAEEKLINARGALGAAAVAHYVLEVVPSDAKPKTKTTSKRECVRLLEKLGVKDLSSKWADQLVD